MDINERTSLRIMLDAAKWDMQADGFTLKSKKGDYNICFEGLNIDKSSSSAFIRSFKVKPVQDGNTLLNEQTYQHDIYDIEMKSIRLTGLDIKKFINESALSILEVSLNLDLKVFHDRVPALPLVSKVGNYPHQLLLKTELPIYIRKIVIKNSLARYSERAKETKLVGNIVFTNIEGEINNVTNNALMIEKNPICKLKGNGILLGKGKCSTNWKLFLNAQNGKFELDGFIGPMNFNGFNSLIKPLALTTVEGQLNSLQFKMEGNDGESHGSMLFLYRDLKLTSYKLEAATHLLEEKKSKSMVSNLFAKNSNASNGDKRLAKFSVQRNFHKSFFNLVWQGVYDGIQNTILNKKVAELKKQMKETK